MGLDHVRLERENGHQVDVDDSNAGRRDLDGQSQRRTTLLLVDLM